MMEFFLYIKRKYQRYLNTVNGQSPLADDNNFDRKNKY